MYEKRGTERVGRGRRKEAIAEILKVIEIDYVEQHFIDESVILVVIAEILKVIEIDYVEELLIDESIILVVT